MNRFKSWTVTLVLLLSVIIMPIIAHGNEVPVIETREQTLNRVINGHAVLINKQSVVIKALCKQVLQHKKDIAALEGIVKLLMQKQLQMEASRNGGTFPKNPINSI